MLCDFQDLPRLSLICWFTHSFIHSRPTLSALLEAFTHRDDLLSSWYKEHQLLHPHTPPWCLATLFPSDAVLANAARKAATVLANAVLISPTWSSRVCLLTGIQSDIYNPLRQGSPTLLAPATGFVQDNFSMGGGRERQAAELRQ